MKLLFDENLSPNLTQALADIYPESAHVHACNLGSADDSAIWQFAKERGFAIVSKDSDFQERSVLLGSPPKIIWIRSPNCTTAEIERLLRAALSAITRFIGQADDSCLILGPRTKSE